MGKNIQHENANWSYDEIRQLKHNGPTFKGNTYNSYKDWIQYTFKVTDSDVTGHTNVYKTYILPIYLYNVLVSQLNDRIGYNIIYTYLNCLVFTILNGVYAYFRYWQIRLLVGDGHH